METLLLSYDDVKELLTMKEVIEAVEEGYIAYDQGDVEQPAIISMEEKANNGETDIKACYNKGNETVSIKVASGFWDNQKNYSLSTMQGTILLMDGRNGLPVCVMDGALITNYRTGAAGAISCKYLAKKSSKVVGMIGAGGQARMQIYALKEVMAIEKVKVYSPVEGERPTYKADIEKETGIHVEICDTVEQAVQDADIAISVTPANSYWIRKEALSQGVHIVAVGADMPGKNEWDPEIFRQAKIVTDNTSQCLSRGETRNAIQAGVINESSIHGEIAEVIRGLKTGRENDHECTIFDTTGMAVQDNVTAMKIYEMAKAKGLGTYFDFKSR